MKQQITKMFALTTLMYSLGATGAFADSFTYSAAGNAKEFSASGTASLATAADSISIQLTDTVINPASIAQNLSAIFFEISTPLSGLPALFASNSGIQRTIASNGTFTDASGLDTLWVPVTSFPNFLGVEGPATPPAALAHTIIGSPPNSRYSQANNTIAGNSQFNPFLVGTVNFLLDVQGVTAATQIQKVNFFFGPLDSQVEIAGMPTPEASSLVLLDAGLSILAGFLMRKGAF